MHSYFLLRRNHQVENYSQIPTGFHICVQYGYERFRHSQIYLQRVITKRKSMYNMYQTGNRLLT
jgi:hypothetical protein